MKEKLLLVPHHHHQELGAGVPPSPVVNVVQTVPSEMSARGEVSAIKEMPTEREVVPELQPNTLGFFSRR